MAEAGQRYLGAERGGEAAAAHRALVERVAAVARRRGDPRWRLLGIEIRGPQEPAWAPPTLGGWAKGEGLEDLAKAELLDLHAIGLRLPMRTGAGSRLATRDYAPSARRRCASWRRSPPSAERRRTGSTADCGRRWPSSCAAAGH